MAEDKIFKRQRRKKRVRARIFGTAKRPRLSVFRSGKHIYAQIIDDTNSKTLVAESDLKLKKGKGSVKVDIAFQVGESLSQKATKKKIKKIVFDRGGYRYHGRVKNVAEGARKGGLEF